MKKSTFPAPWKKVLTPDRLKVLRAALAAARTRGDIEHAERCERELAQLGGRP